MSRDHETSLIRDDEMKEVEEKDKNDFWEVETNFKNYEDEESSSEEEEKEEGGEEIDEEEEDIDDQYEEVKYKIGDKEEGDEEEEEDDEEEEEDKDKEESEFEEKEDNDFREEESDDESEEKEEDEKDDQIDDSNVQADEEKFDGVIHSKLKAIFAGPNNPNFMTLHGYRRKGYAIVRYTEQGGKSVEYDMYNETDFEALRHLVRNPSKGSIWRVLRYEISNTKKSSQGEVVLLVLQHRLMRSALPMRFQCVLMRPSMVMEVNLLEASMMMK